VRHSLASSAYNERRAACEQAVALLQKYLPGIETLRDVTPIEFAALSPYLPETIRRRAEHVVKEIARVESAVTALRKDNRQSLGALMYAGHASLRDLYEVSTLELDLLVSIARELVGCVGARLTGAGFGGCTINVVEEGKAQEFIQGLQEGYKQRANREAQVYLCKASRGAEAIFYKYLESTKPGSRSNFLLIPRIHEVHERSLIKEILVKFVFFVDQATGLIHFHLH
jgi:galactokinase